MLTVKIKTDNAAFEDLDGNAGIECARILRQIANKLERGEEYGPCIDLNGNTVGDWSL
jgi:hypothetical protein